VSKILSQEEIDALLNSAGELDKPARRDDIETSDSVVVYNFRRPDRISKDQIRSLHFLHDRFARNIATSLSAYLRTVTDVTITSVEQFTYSEFLMSLPDPTAFYALSMAPLDGLAALELNPNVAFSMIDRMLGGSGRITSLNRALTEIEQNVIDAVVKLMVESLTETWRSIVDVQFKMSGRETRPQMLQVAAPNEVVVQLGFDIRIGDARGLLNLCIPASAIETVGTGFTQTWHRFRRDPTATDRKHLHDNLARVPLSVAATLDTTLTARELLALRPGDVLSLGHPVRQTLDVRIRGSVKFAGRLVAVGRQAGIRIEDIARVRGAETAARAMTGRAGAPAGEP
jgi:flagellar motor switch protein FliM